MSGSRQPIHGSVLLAEDDADIRHDLAVVLAEEGHDVQTVASGDEALRHMRSSPPCLLLLDLHMPGMTAAQLRRALLADPRLASIPIVVLSAAAEVRETAAALGAVGYVGKPIDLRVLLALIARYC
jgi:CheY-like chemotaxis protein